MANENESKDKAAADVALPDNTDALMGKLINVQAKLKAPKNQFNKFGNYYYRSCEDILEALKPLLAEEGLVLTINDEIQDIGGKLFVKAAATLADCKGACVVNEALAEIGENKGMAAPQLTGAASSYARKYCLNGLFLIDDTKDADTEEYANQSKGKPKGKTKEKEEPLTDQEIADLRAYLETEGIDEGFILEKYKVAEIKQIKRPWMSALCDKKNLEKIKENQEKWKKEKEGA